MNYDDNGIIIDNIEGEHNEFMDALKDMEEYPYEFNYENIGIHAYESWRPKNMISFMADGIRSMITRKH